LIKEEKFSTLLRLLRVTAWVIHYANKLMRSTKDGTLTAQEIHQAKLLWDLHIQSKYTNVIQDIKQGKRNNFGDQLNLQIDD